MATPSLSSAEVLHKLEEQLTCSICFEQYTNRQWTIIIISLCSGQIPSLSSFLQGILTCLKTNKHNLAVWSFNTEHLINDVRHCSLIEILLSCKGCFSG